MNMPKFTTYGCRLNAYETEAMKKLAEENGIKDVAVINTCAVTAEAVRKSKQEIRKLRRDNPDTRIIVTGCAAQIDPDSFAQMKQIDLVLGNSEKMEPSIWAKIAEKSDFEKDSEKVHVNDIMSVREPTKHLIDGFGTRSRAYVQVQNGCDHRCTFCIIPYGRGNSRSIPADVVINQIKRLVDVGYHEVVLTGVDITSWGADLSGAPPLGDLVQRILKMIPDLARLRISSIDSVEVDLALIDAIKDDKRLMPHLHLSLQSGDNMILKRMKRRHLREDAINFCKTIRRARPEIVFGADIIAGFPTETDEMFENSLDLVTECDLIWMHIFPFSPRKGTPAARMPQVSSKVIKERAQILRALGQKAVENYYSQQIGLTHSILMENAYTGRTESFAKVRFTQEQQKGQIVSAIIKGYEGDHLHA